ncbi:putative signal peptide protein [Puccinia sorghi]|uniref:Putative signal peptide protein n=1 Tax=Puccinia sorghi TaxID=27349 RepID=A0A0L6UPU8_9BASI|nr:putative signal peptide protein [Puccinia sorghi]
MWLMLEFLLLTSPCPSLLLRTLPNIIQPQLKNSNHNSTIIILAYKYLSPTSSRLSLFKSSFDLINWSVIPHQLGEKTHNLSSPPASLNMLLIFFLCSVSFPLLSLSSALFPACRLTLIVSSSGMLCSGSSLSNKILFIQVVLCYRFFKILLAEEKKNSRRIFHYASFGRNKIGATLTFISHDFALILHSYTLVYLEVKTGAAGYNILSCEWVKILVESLVQSYLLLINTYPKLTHETPKDFMSPKIVDLDPDLFDFRTLFLFKLLISSHLAVQHFNVTYVILQAILDSISHCVGPKTKISKTRKSLQEKSWSSYCLVNYGIHVLFLNKKGRRSHDTLSFPLPDLLPHSLPQSYPTFLFQFFLPYLPCPVFPVPVPVPFPVPEAFLWPKFLNL